MRAGLGRPFNVGTARGRAGAGERPGPRETASVIISSSGSSGKVFNNNVRGESRRGVT